MLREQVAATLERDLARSAPSSAFAMAVVAALPAMLPQAAKVAVVGAAAKGSAATTGGLVSTLIGPLVAIIAGGNALRRGYRDARSSPERKLIVGFGIALAAIILLGMYGFSKLPEICRAHHASGGVFDLVLSGAWLIFTLAVGALAVWVRRRQAALRARIQEIQPTAGSSGRKIKMPFWLIVGSTAGAMAWMIDLAWKSHDRLAVEVLVVLMVAVIAAATLAFRRVTDARSMRRMIMLYLAVLFLVALAIMNWRFQAWLAYQTHMPVQEVQRHMPIWGMNVLGITVLVCAELLVVVASGNRGSARASKGSLLD
jgi:hypothetical protein